MDIEAIVKKYERLIPAGAYTLGEGIRAALTELAMEYEVELARLWKEMHLADVIRQLEAERVPSPSCRECANRGRVNGLSQESYCDSCVWQGQSFRVNHYTANAAEGGK